MFKKSGKFALSGEGGIRTLGTVARTTVFETVPFDRSGTSPDLSKRCKGSYRFLKRKFLHLFISF